MKVIIIEDKDSKALLDQLELEAMKIKLLPGQNEVDQMHRRFHYIVCKWLQDQGCDVT